MAAQALYRRWRPQSFDDVIGQDHVTRTLQNAVNGDRLAHAYLFTGVRGTGKTSVARILAKAVNCTGSGSKPCNRCSACTSITQGRALDLIEIDAASNTGVDDVRDLREKIGFSPNELTYKVYIVDEVHMLSTAAFNALLKTLEEPPPHAIFILATTEPHKVPDTIVSRCQRHDFRRVPREVLVGKLARIAEAEGVEAEPDALALIARSATGSFRDAESLLDQLLIPGERLTLDLVRDTLGTPAGEIVMELVESLAAGDAASGLRMISAALDQGVDPRQLQSQVLVHLRGLLLVQVGMAAELLDVPAEALARMKDQAGRLSTPAVTAAIHRFNDARPSPDRSQPALPLELALVESVLAGSDTAEPGPARQAAQPSQASPGKSAPRQARSLASPPEATPRQAHSQASPPAATPRQAHPQASPPEAAPRQAHPQASPPEAAARQASNPAPTNPSQQAAPPAPPAPGAAAAAKHDAAAALRRVVDHWDEILAQVATHDKSTAALLKDCRPVAADASSVTLGFFYEFHCGRVSEASRNRQVAAAMAEVLGGSPSVICTMVSASPADTAARPRTKKDQAKTDPLVKHAVENLGAQISAVQSPEDV